MTAAATVRRAVPVTKTICHPDRNPTLSEMGFSPTFGPALHGGMAFAVVGEHSSGIVPPMERTEAELIAAAVKGDPASFEPLIQKYSPRVFATARRYARLEREVEDIVQEVWIKAFQKLASFRGDAPFEHWLMRMAVRTCYDFLRAHQRNRESAFSEISNPEDDWLERFAAAPESASEHAEAAKQLVERVLEQMSPAGKMIIVLLEIEDRSVKEISELTGWSVPLVKVRAFRARAEMRKILARIAQDKYL
jgi:RNA polymerase sigma-70 factor (ECF subfamily)